MTEIQLKYQNHLENVEHNRNTEEQARNELSETVRSNKAREGENRRHNIQTEGETVRHNKVTESQTDKSIKETVRSNKARERENVRSNKARESIQKGTLSESIRSNKANEAIKRETNRIANSKAVAEIAERVSKTKLNEFSNKLREEFPDLFVAQELGKAGGDITDEIAGMLAIASTGTGYISSIASSLGIDLSDQAIVDAIKKGGSLVAGNVTNPDYKVGTNKSKTKPSMKVDNPKQLKKVKSAAKKIKNFFMNLDIPALDH